MKLSSTMRVELTQQECDIIVSSLLETMQKMRETAYLFADFPSTQESIDNTIKAVNVLRNKMIFSPDVLMEEGD